MQGAYPGPNGDIAYSAQRVPAGFGIMFLAGTLSGLLGIGSGAVKVLAMDQAMKLPFKVSTTTSNFMIGVTAAASAGIYLSRGYILPGLAMPVMLGVLGGSHGRLAHAGRRERAHAAHPLQRRDRAAGARNDLQRGFWKALSMDDLGLTNAQSGWNDEKMEASIGMLLRVGVTASALVIFIGGALYLLHPTGPRPGYRVFRGPSAALSHPVVILHGALAGDSRSIISLGLLMLIATPIARMVVAAHRLPVGKGLDVYGHQPARARHPALQFDLRSLARKLSPRQRLELSPNIRPFLTGERRDPLRIPAPA